MFIHIITKQFQISFSKFCSKGYRSKLTNYHNWHHKLRKKLFGECNILGHKHPRKVWYIHIDQNMQNLGLKEFKLITVSPIKIHKIEFVQSISLIEIPFPCYVNGHDKTVLNQLDADKSDCIYGKQSFANVRWFDNNIFEHGVIKISVFSLCWLRLLSWQWIRWQ